MTGLGKGWGKMVDIYSCASMLCYGPTIMMNLMMFMMFQHLICVEEGHNTLDAVFKMFIWSFAACWEGKKPKYDWNGELCVQSWKPWCGHSIIFMLTSLRRVGRTIHSRHSLTQQSAFCVSLGCLHNEHKT